MSKTLYLPSMIWPTDHRSDVIASPALSLPRGSSKIRKRCESGIHSDDAIDVTEPGSYTGQRMAGELVIPHFVIRTQERQPAMQLGIVWMRLRLKVVLELE